MKKKSREKNNPQKASADNKNRNLALNMAAVAVGMLLMAYGFVPMYDLFCRVTGFGGTTQVAEYAPKEIINREITVRFNSDTSPDLLWEFTPLQKQVKVHIGEQKLIFFSATNKSKYPVKGMAVYNVTPEIAGAYFNKIQCFCFDEQLLNPGEKVTFPVSFFIDPEFDKDTATNKIKTITLSYTFFKYKAS